MLPIVGGSTVAFFGDSLTASGATGLWHLQAGGYVDQVNALLRTPINVVSSGVGGNNWALLDARVNTDIVALNPQPSAVVITCAYNDFNQVTAIDTMIASFQSVVNKLKAGIPGVKIAVFNILSGANEQTPDPNAFTVQKYNDATYRVCALNNITLLDISTAKWAYEDLNNTPHPGVTGAAGGPLTLDSVHPNPTGKLLMASVAMARTTVSG